MSWIQDKAPIFTLIGVIGVAFISIFGAIRIESIKDDTAALDRELKQQEVELKRQVFETEKETRTQEILKEWIPKLIGVEASDQRAARAILFVLFPDEADKHISLAFQSLSEAEKIAQAETITEISDQAVQVSESVGPWLIVISNDTDLESARSQAARAAKGGEAPTPVRIYHRGDLYVTTVGDFPDRVDADSATLAVRETITVSAHVVDLQDWCPNADSGKSVVVLGQKISEHECEDQG